MPVIRDADIIGLTGIAAKSAELIEKAREGRLTEADYHGGTFTVSSLGMFDLDDFVAIINPPESAILAVGKIAKTPVVVTDDEGEDQVVIKSMCALCLSYDHRIIDGGRGRQIPAEAEELSAESHPADLRRRLCRNLMPSSWAAAPAATSAPSA